MLNNVKKYLNVLLSGFRIEYRDDEFNYFAWWDVTVAKEVEQVIHWSQSCSSFAVVLWQGTEHQIAPDS